MYRQARRPLRREPCHHDWLLKPKKTFLLQIKSNNYFLTTSSRVQRTQKEIPQTRSSSRHSLESHGTQTLPRNYNIFTTTQCGGQREPFFFLSPFSASRTARNCTDVERNANPREDCRADSRRNCRVLRRSHLPVL